MRCPRGLTSPRSSCWPCSSTSEPPISRSSATPTIHLICHLGCCQLRQHAPTVSRSAERSHRHSSLEPEHSVTLQAFTSGGARLLRPLSLVVVVVVRDARTLFCLVVNDSRNRTGSSNSSVVLLMMMIHCTLAAPGKNLQTDFFRMRFFVHVF